jgi:hypothetical protein
VHQSNDVFFVVGVTSVMHNSRIITLRLHSRPTSLWVILNRHASFFVKERGRIIFLVAVLDAAKGLRTS